MIFHVKYVCHTGFEPKISHLTHSFLTISPTQKSDLHKTTKPRHPAPAISTSPVCNNHVLLLHRLGLHVSWYVQHPGLIDL
jgi:hypothetical protein